MFPYIRQIKVNDCYSYQNFYVIDKVPDTFKHIILTGRNGSGKTTILNRIEHLLQFIQQNSNLEQTILGLRRNIETHPEHDDVHHKKYQLIRH